MKIGSLCTGYGGLDMAVEEFTGGTVAWTSDNDSNVSALIEQLYPDVPNLGDIKKIDWTSVEPVDVLTAGYPCQPFSSAGQRKGEDDPRHIFPFIAEGIRVLRPRVVVLENVRNHLRLGFGSVLGALANLGYDARWCVVRASDAGAPHRRERVFILAWAAHASSERHGSREDGPTVGRVASQDAGQAREWQRTWPVALDRGAAAPEDPDSTTSNQRRLATPGQAEEGGARPDASGRGGAPSTDTNRKRSQGFGREQSIEHDTDGRDSTDTTWGDYEPAISRWEQALGRCAPAPTRPDGRSGALRLNPGFVEWMMGLPAGRVTGQGLSRAAELKLLGNGVVPQQALLALELLCAQS